MTQRTKRSKEEVGEIIKSILVAEKRSSSIGMPIAQLEHEYREQDGTRIPYRALGYPCLMDFLESLQKKGEISIGKRGSLSVIYLCIDEKIAHVSALVSGQKESSKRCRGKRSKCNLYPRVVYQPPTRLDSQTLTKVLKIIKNSPNGISVNRLIECLQDQNNYPVNSENLLKQLRELKHEVSIEFNMVYPNKSVNSPTKNGNLPMKHTTGSSNDPAPAYAPGGCDDYEEFDEFDYVINTDKPQNSQSNGNKNCEKSDNPMNFDDRKKSENPNNGNGNDDNDNDDIGLLVNDRIRFRLEKLIEKHPNGIWCADLPNIYHQEYSIPLNYEDLGFCNVSDFAAHLPEIFHCVRLQENGDFKLFNAKSPKPEASENPRPRHLTLAALHNIYEYYQDESEPAVPVLLSTSVTQRLVPEGVMTIGETVGQICVTQLFSDSTPHIDVVVVDAHTPTFFWIQLLRRTQKFDQFMRDLHEFYFDSASKYVIPMVLLEKGLNCACIYDNKWHRGVIKAVQPNYTVTVFFYDYGTVATYPPQDIYFLHRSFSSLPAQAIPCGLYNVKPISSKKWPYGVCQIFTEKVMDVPMVAMLGSIDTENNSMLIALTNTEGDVDFHISDWMISSGFAVYGKMGETVDLNDKHDDSVTGREQEPSPRLPTIEESNNADSSNSNIEQNPQILEAYEIQLAKMGEAIERQFNAIIQRQFDAIMQSQFNAIKQQLEATIEACASKFHQFPDNKTPEQFADSKAFSNLFDNMKIDTRNVEQQILDSKPPPLPPRPNKSYSQISVNHEISEKNESKNENFNVTDKLQENIYATTHIQKSNVNMNFLENSTDYSTIKVPMPPPYNLDYQMPLKNNSQSNSTILNGHDDNESLQKSSSVQSNFLTSQTSSAFPQTTVTPQHPVSVPQPAANAKFQNSTPPANFCSNKTENLLINLEDTEIKNSTDLIAPRTNFEMSLEENAKNFFARLEAKFKPKNQETNPFKVGIESDKFEEKNSLPVANFSKPTNSVINPFLQENDSIKRNEISTTRSVSSEIPMRHDFSSENQVQINSNPPKTDFWNVDKEREKYEAEKRTNVVSWITQNEHLKPNYFDKNQSCVANGKQRFDENFTGVFPSQNANPNVSGNSKTKQEPANWAPEKTWHFKEIHLTKQSVYLINIDNEGWLTIEEFMTAFTSYTILEVLLKILEIQKVQIPFRYIQRRDYPKLFDELERTYLAVPRNQKNQIGDVLNLVPLKSLIKLLRRLKIVDTAEVELATKKRIFSHTNSALFDASIIISCYANIERDTASKKTD